MPKSNIPLCGDNFYICCDTVVMMPKSNKTMPKSKKQNANHVKCVANRGLIFPLSSFHSVFMVPLAFNMMFLLFVT